MPPFTIDPTELWAAIARLANENDRSWRRTKKGDKRPWQDIEAQKASRRANLKAKRDAATDRILAEANKRNLRRAAPGEGIADRMLLAMKPGEWYGMGDLMRLAGADRSGRSKVHQVLLPRGWVERARNPAWDGVALNPQKIMAGAEPHPQHLYRLTEAGSQRRDRLANMNRPV